MDMVIRKIDISDLYAVRYERASGNIRQQGLEFFRGKFAFDAFKQFVESSLVSVIELDGKHYDPVFDVIEIEGEFCDDIIAGGDWIYYDLEITKVSEGDSYPCVVLADLKFKDGGFTLDISPSYSNVSLDYLGTLLGEKAQ